MNPAASLAAEPASTSASTSSAGPTGATIAAIAGITGARLPRWCLPAHWPSSGEQPALADLDFADGRITAIRPAADAADIASAATSSSKASSVASATPASRSSAAPGPTWHVQGAPVLPGLIEAHTHIDKAFTRHRLGPLQPGLLAAIATMCADRESWTVADVHARAAQSLQWAFDAGVIRLRTHCDWWEPEAVPLAWPVLRELAEEWAGRVAVERVSLIPLHLFAERSAARALAKTVAASGAGALLGGFVHTTNWSAAALRHLLESAEECGLDVDLHVDEELNADAVGLDTTATLLREIGFSGRVVCGHNCALAAQPEARALATLDRVAAAPITLVSLPTTNLLLQDARSGHTPRQRGLTLVKEARARGIPLLIASDNVQDAFCAVGRFDPVEALGVGALAAQLDAPFDDASQTICRGDWLSRHTHRLPLRIGAPADLAIFGNSDVWSWPTRAQTRVVLRDGVRIGGDLPAARTARPAAMP